MNADGFELIERLEKSEGDDRTKLIERIRRCAAYFRAERRAEHIAGEIATARLEDKLAKKKRR